MCFSIKGVEDMKTYTYSETEYFVLQHLYYAMGKNRMKWYEFKELMVPSLERVKNINKTTGEVYNKDTDIIITSTKRGDCVRHRKSLTGGK